jgi:hypothetical protein
MSTIPARTSSHGIGTPAARARLSHPRTLRRIWSYASIGPSGSVGRRVGTALGLTIGSALLAASSVIHLELWSMGYRTIPTIGPLFAIQGLVGLLLAVLLVVSRRLLMVVLAAGFMMATIGGLLLSISFGLFGFTDTLGAPYAGLSLGIESAGVALLAIVGGDLVRGGCHSDHERPRGGLKQVARRSSKKVDAAGLGG